MKIKIKSYTDTIKQLKQAILSSRYRAAVLANRELLVLYFGVGKVISERTAQGKWGDKILDQVADDLQKELPGLKGFSATNIKRMKAFYNVWNGYFTISPSLTDQLQKGPEKKSVSNKSIISPSLTDQLQKGPEKKSV